MLPPENVLSDDVKPLTCDDCPVAEYDSYDPLVWCNVNRWDAARGVWEAPSPQAVVEGKVLPCARSVMDHDDLRLLARRILKTLECAGEEVAACQSSSGEGR